VLAGAAPAIEANARRLPYSRFTEFGGELPAARWSD
jgi:hypothetical protein